MNKHIDIVTISQSLALAYRSFGRNDQFKTFASITDKKYYEEEVVANSFLGKFYPNKIFSDKLVLFRDYLKLDGSYPYYNPNITSSLLVYFDDNGLMSTIGQLRPKAGAQGKNHVNNEDDFTSMTCFADIDGESIALPYRADYDGLKVFNSEEHLMPASDEVCICSDDNPGFFMYWPLSNEFILNTQKLLYIGNDLEEVYIPHLRVGNIIDESDKHIPGSADISSIIAANSRFDIGVDLNVRAVSGNYTGLTDFTSGIGTLDSEGNKVQISSGDLDDHVRILSVRQADIDPQVLWMEVRLSQDNNMYQDLGIAMWCGELTPSEMEYDNQVPYTSVTAETFDKFFNFTDVQYTSSYIYGFTHKASLFDGDCILEMTKNTLYLFDLGCFERNKVSTRKYNILHGRGGIEYYTPTPFMVIGHNFTNFYGDNSTDEYFSYGKSKNIKQTVSELFKNGIDWESKNTVEMLNDMLGAQSIVDTLLLYSKAIFEYGKNTPDKLKTNTCHYSDLFPLWKRPTQNATGKEITLYSSRILVCDQIFNAALLEKVEMSELNKVLQYELNKVSQYTGITTTAIEREDWAVSGHLQNSEAFDTLLALVNVSSMTTAYDVRYTAKAFQPVVDDESYVRDEEQSEAIPGIKDVLYPVTPPVLSNAKLTHLNQDKYSTIWQRAHDADGLYEIESVQYPNKLSKLIQLSGTGALTIENVYSDTYDGEAFSSNIHNGDRLFDRYTTSDEIMNNELAPGLATNIRISGGHLYNSIFKYWNKLGQLCLSMVCTGFTGYGSNSINVDSSNAEVIDIPPYAVPILLLKDILTSAETNLLYSMRDLGKSIDKLQETVYQELFEVPSGNFRYGNPNYTNTVISACAELVNAAEERLKSDTVPVKPHVNLSFDTMFGVTGFLSASRKIYANPLSEIYSDLSVNDIKFASESVREVLEPLEASVNDKVLNLSKLIERGISISNGRYYMFPSIDVIKGVQQLFVNTCLNIKSVYRSRLQVVIERTPKNIMVHVPQSFGANYIRHQFDAENEQSQWDAKNDYADWAHQPLATDYTGDQLLSGMHLYDRDNNYMPPANATKLVPLSECLGNKMRYDQDNRMVYVYNWEDEYLFGFNIKHVADKDDTIGWDNLTVGNGLTKNVIDENKISLEVDFAAMVRENIDIIALYIKPTGGGAGTALVFTPKKKFSFA